MTENIEAFINNSIRIRDRIGTIYIDDHYSPEDILKIVGDNTALIIPEKMENKIGNISGKMRRVVSVNEEGCLSLEGTRRTKRFKKIKVKYMDESFRPQTSLFEGWTAQIIQHECDHLEGIII